MTDRQTFATQAAGLALADSAAFALAGAVSALLAQGALPLAFPSWIVWIAFCAGKGHYSGRALWIRQVGQVAGLAFVLFLVQQTLRHTYIVPGDALRVALFWPLVALGSLGFRRLVRRVLRGRGLWTRDAVVTGGGDRLLDAVYAVQSDSFLPYKVVAVVAPGMIPAEIERFKQIFVGLELKSDWSGLPDGLTVIHADPLEAPGLPAGAAALRLEAGPAQASAFFRDAIVLPERKADGKTPFMKDAMDKAAAGLALILLSPLFLVIGHRVRQDGGKMFYGQTRVGRGGAPFKCWKFRSMVVNADAVLKDLLDNDPAAREEWAKDFKLKNDPRITPVGQFLRKTSLDELPQLINVLSGEMSLVGPRPVTDAEKIFYGPYFGDYMSVSPGITGLWQVSGRNDVSYDRRVFLDRWYVKYWSFWGDVAILFKTVAVVVYRRGAY